MTLTIDNKPIESPVIEKGLEPLLKDDSLKHLHDGDQNVSEQELGSLLDLTYPEKNEIDGDDCTQLERAGVSQEQCAQLAAEYQKRFPQGVKKIKLQFFSTMDTQDGFINSSKIDVNYSNESHYKVQISRQAGEITLRELTKNKRNEEAWIYISGVNKDNKQEEWWYEIGTNETADGARFDAAKIKVISQNFKTINEISFYHIHPEIQNENPLISDTPSAEDFISDVMTCYYLTNVLDTEGKDKIKNATIDFRIVTPSGKYEFVPDLNTFKHHYDDIFAPTINALGYRSKRLELIMGQSSSGTYNERVQKFAQSISTPVLKITFTPAIQEVGE